MTSVLLDSIPAVTDPYASMSTVSIGHMHAVVQWQNPSETTATFRVVKEDGTALSGEKTVSSGSVAEAVLFALIPGTSTHAYLTGVRNTIPPAFS